MPIVADKDQRPGNMGRGMETHFEGPLMQSSYFIGIIKPSAVLQAAHLLKDYDLLPVVPLYRRTVREGAQRRKVIRTFQVLPGVMFLYSDHAYLAQALLAPMGLRLRWIRTPDGTPAECGADEIKPLFEWAQKVELDNFRETYVRKEEPPKPLLYEGQALWIKDGPFAGLKGYLVRGATDEDHVTLNLENSTLRIEVPRDFVVTAKNACKAGQHVQ